MTQELDGRVDAGKVLHTPGPWRASKRKPRLVIGENGAVIALATPRNRSRLGDPRAEDRAEAEANARLIAAAPEMLEACKALIEYDERPDDGPNAGVQMIVDYDRALTLARAAIARATDTSNDQ